MGFLYNYLSQECLKVCWAWEGRETAKQATNLELYKGLYVFLFFFSYYLASSLDSLGNQKPECTCIPNSPYHHRTEALICFSAMDYRNQIVSCLGSLVCVFFLPLLWRALKHFTGEHWKREKRSPSVLQLPLHCQLCPRGNADPQQ